MRIGEKEIPQVLGQKDPLVYGSDFFKWSFDFLFKGMK